MADVGFVFTTVFLVSYGFVKTVLLDFSPSTAIFAKAKFGKRKFFLRHPVDMAFERTNNCLRDTINGI